MHGLEAPNTAAGVGSQCDQRVGVETVAKTLASVIVRAGAAGRNEDQVAFGIGYDHGPRIGAARRFRAGHRVPRPLELSRARIEAADFAAWFMDGAIILDARPDDHRGSHDSRRRCLLIGG
jgi:hypothetical protein